MLNLLPGGDLDKYWSTEFESLEQSPASIAAKLS